ncbi:hypothetical protein ACQP1K_00475 [Sphaerimonospora sp. CA-214678]|uniref:hypothetical protein n=1 Tax=Sphaerimonospora sp. CA-214678 TaxID=3240029 RepID=UPI003D8D21C7
MPDYPSKTQAFLDFERNLEYAKQLVQAGQHLEAIGVTSFDVGDLYRAAWVQAVAALDHWVHQEVYHRAILLAQQPGIPKPRKFREFTVPMDLFEDVHHGTVPLDQALRRHLRQVIGRRTFQGPEDIKDGFAIISDVALWDNAAKAVSEELPDGAKRLTAKEVKQMLGAIVWRRNKITHESDRDPDDDDRKRPISSSSAMDAVETLEVIAAAILVAVDRDPRP